MMIRMMMHIVVIIFSWDPNDLAGMDHIWVFNSVRSHDCLDSRTILHCNVTECISWLNNVFYHLITPTHDVWPSFHDNKV